MRKPSIFIGCASESRDVADALAQQLERDAEITVYDEGPFGLSSGTLEDLNEATDTFDFAVLILTADDLTTSRDVRQPAPRDNVLFELGLFMGRLGRHRTFAVYDRSAAPKLPSDLAGVGLAEYDGSRSDGNLVAAVRTACTKIRENVKRYESLDLRGPRELPLPGGGVTMREGHGDWVHDVQLGKAPRERSVRLHDAVLRVVHGQIEASEPDGTTAIVLPANEFFDDECINDSGSSLGAFVQAHFGAEQTQEFSRIVQAELVGSASSEVEKRPGMRLASYGIGTCVFLDRALGSAHRLILTSITIDREEGLRSEMSYVFTALRRVLATMAEHRLRRVVMPLLGAGHGCLQPDVSLLAIALAVADLVRSPAGQHLRDATVVVFEGPDGKADLPMSAIERVLTTAAAIAG